MSVIIFLVMKNTHLKKWLLFLGIVVLALLVLVYFAQQSLTSSTTKPSPTPITTASGNIIISSPVANEGVSQQFQVKGKIRVVGETFSLRVKNKVTGKVYLFASAPVNPQVKDTFTDFVYDAQLAPDQSLRSGEELLLEVFQTDASGKEVDTVAIPLQFVPLIDDGSLIP